MGKQNIKIGITQGDINGIGYEVILKSFAEGRITEVCTPILYGSGKAISAHRKTTDIPEMNFTLVNSAKEATNRRLYLVNCMDDNINIEIGKSTPEGGLAAAKSLQKAIADLKDGHLDAIVTAPINKHNIQSSTFNYPGHTELFMDAFNGNEVLMFMISPTMRIGVVSGHIPLQDVAKYLTTEKILAKLKLMQQSLTTDFGIRKPKIAVLSLNPHAGDNGLLGNEEQKVIIPAIEAAKDQNMLVFGPFPADGFFGSDNYSKYDAILAMYHDQGLIPFKALEHDQGVNFTAGLSVIRTSPAHGTAYEIAGQNKANPNSFRQAIYEAIDIFKNREMYSEISKNPLKEAKQVSEKNSIQ